MTYSDKELSGMSDKWLDALIEQKEIELRQLTGEHDWRHWRRRPAREDARGARHAGHDVRTLRDLERIVREFGDAFGFDSYVTLCADGIKFAERSQ